MKKLFFTTALLLAVYFKTHAQTPCGAINAGPDIDNCFLPGSGISLNAQATGHPSVVWRSTGSGYFSDSSLTAIYFPTPQDYINGSIKIIAGNMGNNACALAFDTLVITFKQRPSLNDGADFSVCNFDSIPLHASTESGNTITWMGGDGKFLPDNHSADVVYFSGTNDKKDSLLLIQNVVQSPNGCLNYDSVYIFHATNFYVNAGSDQYGCSSSFELNGFSNTPASKWASSGSGTFSPNNTSLNATYTPSQADISGKSVVLTLTASPASGCQAVSDTVVISINPGSFTISTYDNACVDTLHLWATGIGSSGVTWTTSGTGTFSNTGLQSDNTYNITSADRLAGSITISAVRPANANCNEATGTLTIKTFPKPSVNAGADQLRYGYTDAQLAGTIINSSGGVWTAYGTGVFSDNTDLNASYTASAADLKNGLVVLSLSSMPTENCYSISDEVVIYFNDYTTISGLIYAANDSGIVANVSLYKNVGGSFQLDTTISFTRNYSFKRESGQYIVLAQPVVPANKYLPTYYNYTSDWHKATIIDMEHSDVNLNILLIPAPADSSWIGNDSISGYVTLGQSNSNLRTAATSVQGANVLLLSSTGETLTSTTTDSNGHYSFGNIAKGDYVVKVDYPQLSAVTAKVTVDGNPQTVTLADLKPSVEPVEGLFGAAGKEMTLNFYPNPVKETLTINLPAGTEENMNVSIFAATGMSLLTTSVQAGSGSAQLNLQTLPQGFYILQLSDRNNTYRNKFYKTN